MANAHSTDAHPDPLKELGPHYFNPLIGSTHAETLDNISDAMQFIWEVLRDGKALNEGLPGLTLFTQTVWAAAQYSAMPEFHPSEATP